PRRHRLHRGVLHFHTAPPLHPRRSGLCHRIRTAEHSPTFPTPPGVGHHCVDSARRAHLGFHVPVRRARHHRRSGSRVRHGTPHRGHGPAPSRPVRQRARAAGVRLHSGPRLDPHRPAVEPLHCVLGYRGCPTGRQ